MLRIACCWILLGALLPVAVHGRVVINEIFYHAPNEIADLEYVEIYNSGSEQVDLTGWAFTKGIKFRFAPGTRIAPKGFMVLCRDPKRFREYYSAPVAGIFTQRLKKNGAHLQLANASGEVVDSVKYSDTPPWPASADGFSGSLERICPDADGENVSNWACSPLSADRTKPSGTPGAANANYAPSLPPVISNVRFAPQDPAPDQPIQVTADVTGIAEPGSVTLLYRLAGPGFEKPEVAAPMQEAKGQRYSASIPGQGKDQLVRFRIQASAKGGPSRYFPAQYELRPALSVYVHDTIVPAKIPFAWIIDTTEAEFRAGQERATEGGRRGFGPNMFGPGRRGGPFGGGGPGGPDPNEEARRKARSTLERGLDLASAWFELTGRAAPDQKTVMNLRSVFAAKALERNKLIDEVLDSPSIQEKLKNLPAIIEAFNGSLADSLRPLVSEEQSRALDHALAPPASSQPKESDRLFADAAAVVREWVNLEQPWYALTARAPVEPPRFTELRGAFQQLDRERSELEHAVARLRTPEDGLRELKDRAEDLKDRVERTAGPSAAAAAEREPPSLRPRLVLRDGPGPFGGGRGPFRFGPGRFRSGPGTPASGKSAFVYFDPAVGKVQLFDFVDVVPRASGQKVHFHKDRPFQEMTTVNLIYEGAKSVLVEPLAYELYRRVGVPAEKSFQVRLWIDGRPAGFQLLIEQPNRAFLRRNKIADDGNLYKILWYEQGVVGQHEKKTRVHEGHEDIVRLIEALQRTTGEDQWRIIRENFDVPEVVNYFAASMALSNWDGFFNNYFTYHDVGGTGRWTMFPWDEDQTWGVMGPWGQSEVFYTMPITFGMNGDTPPGQLAGSEPGGFGFGFRGGAMWWRQPGWFSGPLLANPQFRKVFLARTREILETIYIEPVFLPIINDMGDRLRPEIKLRAEIFGEQPERALEDFEQSLQALRDHLKKRRQFLLAQDEMKNAR